MSNNVELFKKIDKVLEKAPENRHSYYKLKYFVIGKEHTTQAQLWQCLRELQSRKETIETLELQIADIKDEIELINLDYEKFYAEEVVYQNTKLNSICKKEKEIKIRKLKRKEESLLKNINKLERKLEFTVQEARFFYQAFEALEKIESLKDYDDYEVQKEFWEAKISEEINLRVLMRQPIPPDVLKTALSLHETSEVKERTIKLLENTKSQMIAEKEKNVGQIAKDK